MGVYAASGNRSAASASYPVLKSNRWTCGSGVCYVQHTVFPVCLPYQACICSSSLIYNAFALSLRAPLDGLFQQRLTAVQKAATSLQHTNLPHLSLLASHQWNPASAVHGIFFSLFEYKNQLLSSSSAAGFHCLKRRLSVCA